MLMLNFLDNDIVVLHLQNVHKYWLTGQYFYTEFVRMLFSFRTSDVVCVDLLCSAYVCLIRLGFTNPCESTCRIVCWGQWAVNHWSFILHFVIWFVVYALVMYCHTSLGAFINPLKNDVCVNYSKSSLFCRGNVQKNPTNDEIFMFKFVDVIYKMGLLMLLLALVSSPR
jgi:hypothetical protein